MLPGGCYLGTHTIGGGRNTEHETIYIYIMYMYIICIFILYVYVYYMYMYIICICARMFFMFGIIKQQKFMKIMKS